jgi:hypothetical protein
MDSESYFTVLFYSNVLISDWGMPMHPSSGVDRSIMNGLNASGKTSDQEYWSMVVWSRGLARQ